MALSRRQCLVGLAAASLCALPASARAQPAPRIAVADWAAAECLLALGVTPLAVCDTATYRQWMTEIALPPQVLDLGARAEPNLELLAALRPELVLISNFQANLLDLLRPIAPAETVSILWAGSEPFANARTALTGIAERLSRPANADRYLAAFDTAISMLAEAPAIARDRPVYVGVLHEAGTQVFLYGPGSWVHTVMGRLGLRNALRRPTSAFGNALVDLAELAASPDAVLLYLDQGQRTRRAERILRTSTLWQALPMVQHGRTRTIPPFYALGGIPSIWRCARLLAAALGGPADAPHG